MLTALTRGPVKLNAVGVQQDPLGDTFTAISPVLRPQSFPHSNSFVFGVDGAAGNLRVKPNGEVDSAGGRGIWAQFEVEEHGESIRIMNVGHQQKSGKRIYLRATRDGFAPAVEGDATFFAVVDAASCDAPVLTPVRPPAPELTHEQKASFVRDGVLVLKGLVPPELVHNALRTINAQLGKGPDAWAVDEDNQPTLRHGGAGRAAAIADLLLRSPAIGAAEQLLGRLPPAVYANGPRGQIALRFPMDPETARSRPDKGDDQWHVDGQEKHHHMSGFQLLLGVALSSQPTDDCGNLHVWPGAHAVVHSAVARHRAQRAADPAAAAASANFWLGHRPALPADGCTQLHLEPGDVVLAHQKLPHRIGLNRSPHIRYQVYFRLSAATHDSEAALGDVFDGWDASLSARPIS